MPHPYLVPTSPSASRSTQSIGVSASTSTERDCPFTRNVYVAMVSRLFGVIGRWAAAKEGSKDRRRLHFAWKSVGVTHPPGLKCYLSTRLLSAAGPDGDMAVAAERVWREVVPAAWLAKAPPPHTT